MAPKASTTPPVWITVRFSDADPSIVPEENDGNGGTFVKNEIGSTAYYTYASKCGEALVKFAPELVDPAVKDRVHLCLLPKGFSVWTHKKGSRTDSYCYGLPHGKKFRSPNEFIKHLTWLATLQTDDETDPEAWIYCGEPKEYDQSNYHPIPSDTDNCECKYCQQAVPKPKMPPAQKSKAKEVPVDVRTKRELKEAVDRIEARRQDHWWKISGLTALELKFRDHKAYPFRMGEIVNYIGPGGNYKLLRVVITGIMNEKKVFEDLPFERFLQQLEQAIDEGDTERVCDLENRYCTDFYHDEPSDATSHMRTLQEEPRYIVRICELGRPAKATKDLHPADRQFGAGFLPGRIIEDVLPTELFPYLLHPLDPNLPLQEKDARGEQWLAELAAKYITPFATLPWDYYGADTKLWCLRDRYSGKGFMYKVACAFVGAEKINQYDLVRISGPGPKILDSEKIRSGYWQYLPLSLNESIMKVSCFVVYVDDNRQVTHINVRGRVFSPFPLKPDFKTRVITDPREVPISKEEMRKWPRICSAPGIDVENLDFEWYQYFPSITDGQEVEIPMYADVDSSQPQIPLTTQQKEAKKALTSSVMPLTPEDFVAASKMRRATGLEAMSGIDLMRSELLTRFKRVKVDEGKPMHAWEESLLRSIDILGRFYSPVDIYTWSVTTNPHAELERMPTTPLALSRHTADKCAPQRAQAFQWAYIGDQYLRPDQEETVQVPTLNTMQLTSFFADQVFKPSRKPLVAPWEHKQCYSEKEIDYKKMLGYPCTEKPAYFVGPTFSTEISERLCRRVGPLPDTPEAHLGTHAIYHVDQRRNWMIEDQSENLLDDQRWAEYGWVALAKRTEEEIEKAKAAKAVDHVAKSPVKTLVERPHPGASPIATAEENERKRKRLSEVGLVSKRAGSISSDGSVASQTPRAGTQAPRPLPPATPRLFDFSSQPRPAAAPASAPRPDAASQPAVTPRPVAAPRPAPASGPQQPRTITSFFGPANGGTRELGQNGSMIYPKQHPNAFGGGGSSSRTSGPQ